MGFGTAQMTVTTGDVFIPETWAREIEIARESNKVLAGLVNRRDTDVKRGGDVLHIPFVSNLSANAKSANTAVTFQAPTETDVDVNLNRYYEASVMIEDRLDLQSAYELATQYQRKIGEAINKQVETDLAGLYSSLSQTVGTGHATLTEANVVRGEQYLNDANAPISDRHFVVRPAAMNHLNQIARFTEFQTTGNQSAPMVGGNNGRVGKVFSLTVHMTTDIAQVSGTPGIVHNLMFHRDAFVLAMQKSVSVETERSAEFLGTAYVASALWGYAELRDDHAVDIRTVINT